MLGKINSTNFANQCHISIEKTEGCNVDDGNITIKNLPLEVSEFESESNTNGHQNIIVEDCLDSCNDGNDDTDSSSGSSYVSSIDPSAASLQTVISRDEILSDCDKGNEKNDRFNMEDMNDEIKPLCKCLDMYAISDLHCPSNTGKNMTEFDENDLISLFYDIIEREKILTKKMAFLDIGSGKGVPQFILWYLHKIASHGIEISPFYTKVALQALIEVKKFKHEEDVTVSFSCMDVTNLTSLDPYQFIFCAITGYVYEYIR